MQAELAELAAADAPPPAPPPLADTPYRGLEVFDVDHAHLFFGREALTAKLLDRIDQARFLVVVGPFGDRVVAASLDGSVDVYVASIDRLLEIAQARVTRKLTCRERVQFLYEDRECPAQETATPEP